MNLSYRKIHEKSPRQIPKVRPPVKPPAAFRAIKGNIDRRMVASECAQVIFQKKTQGDIKNPWNTHLGFLGICKNHGFCEIYNAYKKNWKVSSISSV